MASPLGFHIRVPGYINPYGEELYNVGDQILCYTINTHVNLTFSENTQGKCELCLENYKHTTTFSIDDFKKNMLSQIPPLVTNSSVANFNWETPELLDLKKLMPKIITYVNAVAQKIKLTDMYEENALYSFFLVAAGMLCSIDLEIEPFSILIQSDIPTSISAGSVPAHSVSIAAAFVHYIRIQALKNNKINTNISKPKYKTSKLHIFNIHTFDTTEKDIIFRWSCLCEKLMPRDIYGIGSSVCTYGYIMLFSKGENEFRPSLKPFVHVQEIEILIVDTGIKQDTNAKKEALTLLRECFPEVLEAMLVLDKMLCEVTIGLLADSKTPVKEPEYGSFDICDLLDLSQGIQLALEFIHPDLQDFWYMMRHLGFKSKIYGNCVNGSLFIPLLPKIQERSIRGLKNFLKKKGCLFLETQMCVYGLEINNANNIKSF